MKVAGGDQRGVRMADSEESKPQGYIWPGTPEHDEITKAFEKWFDKMSSNDNPYYEDPGRNSYYSKPEGIPAGVEDLQNLWSQGKLVVHFSSDDENEMSASKEFKPRTKQERWLAKDLGRLAGNGGYVWVESPRGDVKVGRVSPETSIESVSVPKQDLSNEDNSPSLFKVTLRTLQLTDTVEVGPGEAMDLRATTPHWPNLTRWSCRDRLADLVEGRISSKGWAGLRPEIRLAVCAEFLRGHQDQRYPGLSYLLLPARDRDPGRQDVDPNPYGVDLVGIGRDGEDLFAQVPLENDNQKYNVRMGRKARQLLRWRSPGKTLICFWDPWSAYLGYEAEGDPEPWEEKGILYIRIDEVLRWVESQSGLAERVFYA